MSPTWLGRRTPPLRRLLWDHWQTEAATTTAAEPKRQRARARFRLGRREAHREVDDNSFIHHLINCMIARDGALEGQGELRTGEGMAGGMGEGQREEQGPLMGV